MNIIVVSSFSPQNSGAPANRMLSYCKGFIELGHNVKILVMANSDLDERVQFIDGIEISYLRSQNKKTNLFLIGKFFVLSSLILSFRKLNCIISASKDISGSILVSDNFLITLLSLFVLKLNRIKVFTDRSEYPEFMRSDKIDSFRYLNSKMIFFLDRKFYSGMFIMTRHLINFYSAYTKTPYVHIPMTVDISRFETPEKNQVQKCKYYAYCGDMTGNKDGVVDLLHAYKLFCETHSDVKLYLIGGCQSEEDFIKIKTLSEEIGENVVLVGRLNRDEIVPVLKNARALLLARPANKQAEGGFPTKLGEYLLTGKPVVVTRTGEIPDYLEDGFSAFMCEPNNPEAFAEKMEELEKDYDRSLLIGKNGKNVAIKEFNYLTQSKKMLDFIMSV